MVSTVGWILSGVAAAGFLMAGAMKVFAYEKLLAQSPHMASIGKAKAQVLGALELLGAAGLILPIALDVAPVLSGVAAVGLSLIGFGALGAHIKWGEAAKGAFPAVLGIICAMLAFHHLT